jgi:CO/xanthine dehydrogenase Mo-binding subunit
VTEPQVKQGAASELRVVGKPVERVDAMGKAIGATHYAGDYRMPNMLHGKVVRAGVPHARIRKIDVRRARALPGVVCILTAADLAGGEVVTDLPGQTGQKRLETDQPVLARDRVRYQGEPIALIAAETRAIAERAAEMVEVDLETLPVVADLHAALQPDAPEIHPEKNVVSQYHVLRGDIEAGFEASKLVVENIYSVPFIDQAYLEPEVGLAWVDEDEVINIRVSTQVVEHFRSIAAAVGVPQNKVRVRGALVGGGFGGKEDITVEVFLAILAKVTRRPVRLAQTREESLIGSSKRHPFWMSYRTGVAADGRIMAQDIQLISDAGAYVYLSPYVLLYATATACGPYRTPNARIEAKSVATNNTYTSAMRGFGTPQVCFALEAQMDEIARKLDMDPLELRRRNYLTTGEQSAIGQTIQSAVWLEECADRAWKALGEKEPGHGPVKVGRGIATYMQSYGRITWMHDTSEAWVGVELDGSVVVRSGVPDIGGGQISSLCQIAAEVLGVPLTEVRIHHTDSAVTPLSGTTTATRQLYMSGNAVFNAASAVRERLLNRAALQLEVRPEELDMADASVFVRDDPSQRIGLPDLAGVCAAEGIPRGELAMFRAPFRDKPDFTNLQADIFPDYTFGAHAAEVAVDTETGEITVLKSVGAHDVGRAINPDAVAGQIEGAAAMGQGYALTEEAIYDQGVLMTRSLTEYLIPTAEDVGRAQAIILESGTGLGPFGAKGIGEPSLSAVAPAIANALTDAIGIRFHELPITAEKVVMALEGAEED